MQTLPRDLFVHLLSTFCDDRDILAVSATSRAGLDVRADARDRQVWQRVQRELPTVRPGELLGIVPLHWIRRLLDLQSSPGTWILPRDEKGELRLDYATESSFIESVIKTTFYQRGITDTRSGDLLFSPRTLYALMGRLTDGKAPFPYTGVVVASVRRLYTESPASCSIQKQMATYRWLCAWRDALLHWRKMVWVGLSMMPTHVGSLALIQLIISDVLYLSAKRPVCGLLGETLDQGVYEAERLKTYTVQYIMKSSYDQNILSAAIHVSSAFFAMTARYDYYAQDLDTSALFELPRETDYDLSTLFDA